MMNIVFVHDHILRKIDDDYYSTGGLACNIMHRYLFERGSKIRLITRCKKTGEAEKKNLVRVNDERVICAPSNIYKGPRDLLKARHIRKKEILPTISLADLVIIRLPSFLGFMAYNEARKMKKKIIIELVACPLDSFWYHGGMFGKLAALVLYVQTKYACKNAENVLYVSEKFLQNRYPTEGRSISCSDVSLSDIKESTIKQRIKKIKSKKNVYKIGLVGSLDVNFKGHREAILSMEMLVKKGYRVELHCLGQGEKKRWEDFARRYGVEGVVFFDGTLPAGEKVFKWLDEIDVFIMPSLQEGLPRALVEAMSRGCPVVGMNTGGIPELIRDEVLCKKKDYRKLANNIGVIIDNPKYAEELAKENFNKSKEFMPEKLQQKRKEFLQSIIEGGAK